ncbi:MAG: 6-phosphofructokinase [Planctomycetota bacterium]|jgi:6-phosphofructokinase 1
MTNRIAILTGGGDCPGLNAVIRAVVRSAQSLYGWEVYGVRDGMEGFLRPVDEGLVKLTLDDVTDILPRGGTIIGASNRCDIFAVDTGSGEKRDLSDRVPEALAALDISALIMVGGDGTHKQAHRLMERGIPVVGIPKTIDNDLGETDVTFGFDTAVGVVAEALDRLRSTAESHHRVMCVEVMGRHAGWLALYGGLAGGADVILIPEIPYDPDMIARRASSRVKHGRRFSLVVVAEGARRANGEAVYRRGEGKDPIRDRLGGVSYVVADELRERALSEVRNIILGHLQRGGTPSPFDRILATRLGVHAVGMVERGEFGRMAALREREITSVDIGTVIHHPRRVDPHGQRIQYAREVGISFAAADGSDDAYARLRSEYGVP